MNNFTKSLTLSLVLSASAAHAETILDHSPTAIHSPSYSVQGAYSNMYYSSNYVTRFTLDTDAVLSGIEAWTGSTIGTVGGGATVRIFNDAGTSPSSLAYYISTTVVARDTADNAGTGFRRVAVSFSQALSAGSYWIGVSAGASNNANYGFFSLGATNNPIGTNYQVINNSPNGSFAPTPFYRVSGELVAAEIPLPATAPALALAAGALAAAAGRRRKG